MFSVIIPTCNRKLFLIDCLTHLEKSIQYAGERAIEVIITNDGFFSADDVNELKVLLSCKTIVVEGPKRGPAANRNNGAKYAKGKWLIFLDDDVVPDKKLVKVYQEAIFSHPLSGAFEGAIHPDNWELMKRDLAECPVNTTGNCFWSANIVVKKEIFEQIGGFDEQFKLAAQEDQDLFIRLKHFYNIQFIPEAKVIHAVREAKLWKKITQINDWSRSFSYYSAKHRKELGNINSYVFFVRQVKTIVIVLLKSIKNKHYKLAILNIIYLVYRPIYCTVIFSKIKI